MKMSPPWSRRRCTHPQRVTVFFAWVLVSSPQVWVRSMEELTCSHGSSEATLESRIIVIDLHGNHLLGERLNRSVADLKDRHCIGHGKLLAEVFVASPTHPFVPDR